MNVSTVCLTSRRLALMWAGSFLMLFSCSGDGAGSGRHMGASAQVGDASITSFADVDVAGVPTAIGLQFSANFFDELPTEASDQHQCFDRNGDGTITDHTECNMWHEWVIPLPSVVASHHDVPFKWALMNWNPAGHIPPGIYDTPHFDIHFYIAPIEDVMALKPGPCGPEFVRCDQFEIATKPVPANFVAPDFQDVQAVAPAMGNHLIDMTSSEFQGEPFTRTWIYGTYDGKVTFYEEMVTRQFLLSHPQECFDIKAPPAFEVAGYYPTQSCLRYDEATGAYTVSMEGFVHRDASPPAVATAGM